MASRAARRAAWLATLACLSPSAQAQQAPAEAAPFPTAPAASGILQPVLISAEPLARRPWTSPASLDVVSGDAVRSGLLEVNLSESLGAVPGVVALNRQNYAQDLQVSIRGFGARSTFGVRGLRLYVDGIPASAPDGQGQAANFPLGSTQRIEVVRGPFAALYGNASGGVVALYTQEGDGSTQWRTGAVGGSEGTWRASAQGLGHIGTLDYALDVQAFGTGGQRPQSAARRDNASFKLAHAYDGGRIVLLASRQTSNAQDPLGLSRAEFDANPGQTTPTALQYDTRKTLQQSQAGLAWEQQLTNGHRVELMAYAGNRDITQFQAIPASTQASAGSPGGVIDLARRYGGANLRWRWQGDWAGGRLSTAVGLAWDQQDEHRRGYENFAGGTAASPSGLGQLGRLRRDEDNRATSREPYAQFEWSNSAWTLAGGLRRSSVQFTSADHFITAGNGDDSGRTSYGASMPVLGLRWRGAEDLQLFASTGLGLETPTLNEVAYQANGAAGLNSTLKASRSQNSELGLRGRSGDLLQWSATAFDTRTRDELTVLSNSGGRTSYRNAGRTLRQGLEAWAQLHWPTLQLQSALTLLKATYEDSFLTCAAAPCTTPTLLIPAGNHMPGIPQRQLNLQAQWQPQAGGPQWSAQLRLVGAIAVNDSNSDHAAGSALLNLAARWEQPLGGWTLREFLRLDNALDRRYAGSVIVNEGNGRYFEPGARRAWLLGLELRQTLP